MLSDITARLYDYKYEYKKLHSDRHPVFTTDFSLRIYYRYVNEADRALLQFENIEESYTSATHSYLVGHVKMKELVAKAPLLRQTDVFIAAFPED